MWLAHACKMHNYDKSRKMEKVVHIVHINKGDILLVTLESGYQ